MTPSPSASNPTAHESLSRRIQPFINDVALARASGARAALLGRARGRVLEIGFGSGMSASLYPDGVELVLAVEPSDSMWRRGRERAERVGLRVERLRARAEALPVETASVDVAVSTFVLCSVEDPERVLAELARVVRPGGELLLLEHVKDPRPWTGRFQEWVTPLWTVCFAGCHPGRDLLSLVRRPPWIAIEERLLEFGWLPRVAQHHLAGVYGRS